MTLLKIQPLTYGTYHTEDELIRQKIKKYKTMHCKKTFMNQV